MYDGNYLPAFRDYLSVLEGQDTKQQCVTYQKNGGLKALIIRAVIMRGMVLPVTTQRLLRIPPALSVMKPECFPQNLFTDDSTNRDYFPIEH